jgi:hypothetical protein
VSKLKIIQKQLQDNNCIKKNHMTKKQIRKWEIGTGILTLILIIAFSIMVMLANRGYAMNKNTIEQQLKMVIL